MHSDELLVSASRNWNQLDEALRRLRQYANYYVSRLFSDPIIAEDGVDQAIDKVTDWIGSGSSSQVEHPWQYAKQIIRNSLIDSFRSAKEQGMTFTQKLPRTEAEGNRQRHAGPTARAQMRWFDESFARIEDEERDREVYDDVLRSLKLGKGYPNGILKTDQRSEKGWRVFQIIGESPPPRQDDCYLLDGEEEGSVETKPDEDAEVMAITNWRLGGCLNCSGDCNWLEDSYGGDIDICYFGEFHERSVKYSCNGQWFGEYHCLQCGRLYDICNTPTTEVMTVYDAWHYLGKPYHLQKRTHHEG